MLYRLGHLIPKTGARLFVAPGAAVIGNVILEEDVSIWFNVVVRGDNDVIRIGQGSNVQECSVLHVDEGFPMDIGQRVTVGHKAMLHGCTIGDDSLIGMNAVVLNGAVIGKQCLIGANALVTEGMQVPDGSLVLGSPGKVVKTLDEAAFVTMAAGARNYIDKISVYSESLEAL